MRSVEVDASLPNGIRVAGGDVSGDGRDEIVVTPGFGGDGLVRTFNARLEQTAAFSAYNWSGAGMNVALRNAAAQMQVDLVNAGTAYFQGANIPSWPVGVTIVNNVVTSGPQATCHPRAGRSAASLERDDIIDVGKPVKQWRDPIFQKDVDGGLRQKSF